MPSRRCSIESSSSLEKKISDYYRKAYRRYRDSVLKGKRVASVAERQKVERQERDLTEGVSGYRFDMKEGLKPLVWMALNLAFPMGDKQGMPMRLSDWQAYDIIVLFGWVRDDGKGRRYMDAFIEVARKNGKSTFSGALLDYLAFGEKKGVTCYIGATSLDQASETFKRALWALKKAGNAGVKEQNSKNNKVISWGDSEIIAMSGEPKDGKLAYATIIDEYHQHKDNALVDSIKSGNVSDQDALIIRITTAGVSLNGVCHEEYLKCKRVLSGEQNIDSYFVAIYEIDERDSVDDVSVWPKANPNWGVSVDEHKMMALYQDAKGSANDIITFKTKNLNQWCNSLSRWANMTVWMEQCRWDYNEDSLVGQLAYGGLDLASNSDFTAFTLDFPLNDDRHVQLSHFWIPESEIINISRQCRIPLQRWIQLGWVTATPGRIIDYEIVKEYLQDAYEKYQLKFIACDRWKIEELNRIMPSWFQDVAYEFSQGIKTMDPTIRDFERAYMEGRVTDNGNEVVDWMMSCAESYQDVNGNIKIVKPKSRTASRIDGVITSIMALSNAKTNDMGIIPDKLEDILTVW